MALHKVATTKDLPPGGCTCYRGLRQIDRVVQRGWRIYAIDNICTHDSAPLSEGVVTDGCVVCPWHGAEFDLETGEALTPPAVEDVRTYKVVVSGDEICLEMVD